MIRKGYNCVVSGSDVWRGFRCATHITKFFVKTTILFLQCKVDRYSHTSVKYDYKD